MSFSPVLGTSANAMKKAELNLLQEFKRDRLKTALVELDHLFSADDNNMNV